MWGLLKKTFSEWSEDKAPRLAAALSYYTVFSLAPFLVVVIAVVGLWLGQQGAQDEILNQIRGVVGTEGGDAIRDMIAGATRPRDSLWATIIGIALLLLGAGGLFGQLQEALNTIWEVAPRPGRGLLGIIKDRFLSFTMVLGVGFLLLVSLVLSTALIAAGTYMQGLFPGFEAVMQGVSFVFSFIIVTLLFALIFKFLPDAEIAWRDVWLGAAVTSLLFSLGKFAIELYVKNSDFTSTYGIAASLVIILLWVYYIGQVLFFGAEFTQVYANMYGSHIVPEEDAVPLTEEARAQQGIPHGGAEGAAQRQGASGAVLPATGQEAQAGEGVHRRIPEAHQSVAQPPKPRSPADQGIRALGALLVSLVGFSGGLAIFANQSRPAAVACVENFKKAVEREKKYSGDPKDLAKGVPEVVELKARSILRRKK
jgi:membrane protein